MSIPKLKRVKVSSEQDLRNWITKNVDQGQSVMLVTFANKSDDKHLSTAQVRDILGDYGWTSERSYTLNGNLLGHAIRPQ